MIPIWDNAIALLKDAMDRFIPDKSAAAQAKASLEQLREQEGAQEFLAQAEIVKAEAQSSNWLTAAWRPITMLVFVGLIVARVLGLTSEHVTEAEYLKLWSIVEVGLGGYVLSRSAEKIVPGIVQTLKGP
jgi:hypothetical protein